MAKRQVWVVEFKRRKLWQQQISFCGYRARARGAEYLSGFREANPKLEAKLVKYVPEKP